MGAAAAPGGLKSSYRAGHGCGEHSAGGPRRLPDAGEGEAGGVRGGNIVVIGLVFTEVQRR